MIVALATRNKGKIEEIRFGLRDLAVDIRTIDDYPEFPEVAETEPTLEGNAILKSRALFEFVGVPALADDTGLHVNALDGEPGVRSARFAGEGCSPADNRSMLLQRLAGVEDRKAHFRVVLAFTDGSGTQLFEGRCDGEILAQERGTGGFGYDSLFRPTGLGQTFAEITAESKNVLSHRGKAVRRFCDFMRDYHAHSNEVAG